MFAFRSHGAVQQERDMKAKAKGEAPKVLYAVQAWTRRRGELKPDEPRLVSSEAEATRIAEQLARSRAGVVALRRSSEDEWREPEALFIAGDIPDDARDGLRQPEAAR
jgi:hypothetical protein